MRPRKAINFLVSWAGFCCPEASGVFYGSFDDTLGVAISEGT